MHHSLTWFTWLKTWNLLITVLICLNVNLRVFTALPKNIESQSILLGKGHINEIAWSPDGAKLVVASSVGIWIYDLDNANSPSRLINTISGEVHRVSFNRDGSLLAASTNNTVTILKTTNWEALKQIHTPSDGFSSVAFSPDGSKVAVGSDKGTITLWKVSNGQQLLAMEDKYTELCDFSCGVNDLIFSPDGSLLGSAKSNPSTAQLWDPETGMKFSPFHTQMSFKVVFSSDGRYLVSTSKQHHFVSIQDKTVATKCRTTFPVSDSYSPKEHCLLLVEFLKWGKAITYLATKGLLSQSRLTPTSSIGFQTTNYVNHVAISPKELKLLSFR
jgi:WD40 repeat protein